MYLPPGPLLSFLQRQWLVQRLNVLRCLGQSLIHHEGDVLKPDVVVDCYIRTTS